jgi:hypothetical protein
MRLASSTLRFNVEPCCRDFEPSRFRTKASDGRAA